MTLPYTPKHQRGSSLLPCLVAIACVGASLLTPRLEANDVDEFLENPDLILPFLVESTDFWKDAWDPADKAFFTNVNLNGSPRGLDKAFLTQTRNAYAFSKAFMITGDTTYLDYADNALRFMYEYGWDNARGGWWGQANLDGSINTNQWYNRTRWSFWQHYMLLGISALVEANQDPFHVSWLETGNTINDEKLWDARPGFEGYYNHTSLDWVPQNEKGFTPTVDAITTSALTNYLMTRDPMRRERLIALSDNIADKMMDPVHGNIVSFPSRFNNNWEVFRNDEWTSVGCSRALTSVKKWLKKAALIDVGIG